MRALRMARTICPPSSGRAGTRFNTRAIQFNENVMTIKSDRGSLPNNSAGIGRTNGFQQEDEYVVDSTCGNVAAQIARLTNGPAATVRNCERKLRAGCTKANPPNGQIRISSAWPPV